MGTEEKPTLRGAIDTVESKRAAGGVQKYWSSVWINIGTPVMSPDDDPYDSIHFALKLNHVPEYKLGAMYRGHLMIGGMEAVIEAIAVCSFGGGRGWAAWDDRLEDRVRNIHQDGLPNCIELNDGSYLCIIFIIED